VKRYLKKMPVDHTMVGLSRVVRWNLCQKMLAILFRSSLTDQEIGKMLEQYIRKYPLKIR